MNQSRRDALKFILSATALGGIGLVLAPARASADGLRLDAVNVLTYGAAGDGLADDTAAIHAARDAAGVGGKVVIPPGTYLVSGLEADVVNQQWVLSDGAVLTMKTGAPNILKIVGDGVTISGGVFDGSNGTATDWSQHGIRVEANGVTIRDVEVRDSPMHGVYGVNCNSFTVTGCRIIEQHGCGVFVQNGEADTTKYDIVITDNYVNSSLDEYTGGIGVIGGSGVNTPNMFVERATVTNNTVILKINPAFESSCIGMSGCIQYVVSGNILVGSHLGITCPKPTRTIISNNQIQQFNGAGIEIPGTVTDCVVSGNVIDAAGVTSTVFGSEMAGIWHSTTDKSLVRGLRIVGNTISGMNGDVTGIAMGRGTVESVEITSNVIRGGICNKYVGVEITGPAKNVTISRNIFDAGTVATAIRSVNFLSGAVSDVAVAANSFMSTSSRNTNYSISFNDSVTGAAVTGNTFEAPSSAQFSSLFSSVSADSITFIGNTVNGGTSNFSSAMDMQGAVNGMTVSENQFMNLTEAVVRLAASTAVTLQNIRLVRNNVVKVPKQFSDVTSGGAVVATTVTYS